MYVVSLFKKKKYTNMNNNDILAQTANLATVTVEKISNPCEKNYFKH